MSKILLLLLSLNFSGALFGQAIDSLVINKTDELLNDAKKLLYKDLDSAEILTKNILLFAQESEYSDGIGKAYTLLGNISNLRSNDIQSIIYFEKAAKILDQGDSKLDLAKVNFNMAVIHIENEQYEEALRYTLKAHNFFKENNYKNYLISSYSSLGAIYIKTNSSLSQVLSVLNPAEELARQYGDTLRLVQVLNSKAISMVDNDSDYDLAITTFTEAVKLLKLKYADDGFLGFSYMGLSRAYLKKNELARAIIWNDNAIERFENIKYLKGLKEAFQDRVQILEKSKRFEEGFEAYKQLTIYSDTLNTLNKTRSLSTAQASFDVERKETEISSLSQKAAIQELELKQRDQSIIIGISILLLAAVIVYFLYFKQTTSRKRKQIELEQRFLRSQLNPHFISNALVAIQSSLMQNDTDTTVSYLSTFSRLMREILENSREEYITVEEETTMLKDYLEINRRRLEDSFSYKVEIADDIDPEMDTIPPMFVQPFVENALEHGLGGSDRKGEIHVLFSKRSEFIRVEVLDNGEGIYVDKSIQSGKKSLSSSIIKERIELFNRSLKNKIQLSIHNREDKQGNILGTMIELLIPLQA